MEPLPRQVVLQFDTEQPVPVLERKSEKRSGYFQNSVCVVVLITFFVLAAVKAYFYSHYLVDKAELEKALNRANFYAKPLEETSDDRARLWLQSHYSIFKMLAPKGQGTVQSSAERGQILQSVFESTVGKEAGKELFDMAESSKTPSDKNKLLKRWEAMVMPFRRDEENFKAWNQVLKRLFLVMINYRRMTSEKSLKAAGHLSMCKDATEELVLLADASFSAESVKAALADFGELSGPARPLNQTQNKSPLRKGDLVMVRRTNFEHKVAKVGKVMDLNVEDDGLFAKVKVFDAPDNEQVQLIEKETLLKIELKGDGLLTLFCELETHIWWVNWERNRKELLRTGGQSSAFETLSDGVSRLLPIISAELEKKNVNLDDNPKVANFLKALESRSHPSELGLTEEAAQKYASGEMRMDSLPDKVKKAIVKAGAGGNADQNEVANFFEADVRADDNQNKGGRVSQ